MSHGKKHHRHIQPSDVVWEGVLGDLAVLHDGKHWAVLNAESPMMQLFEMHAGHAATIVHRPQNARTFTDEDGECWVYGTSVGNGWIVIPEVAEAFQEQDPSVHIVPDPGGDELVFVDLGYGEHRITALSQG